MNLDPSPFRALSWDKGTRNYHIIAGPCSAESEEQTLAIAQQLKAQGIKYYRASLWKPRTRPGGFEGVGYNGLPWLRTVQIETGMQVMTEVATAAHIEAIISAGLRHIWIGARTTSSPFAMAEIAEALRGVKDVSVLVKNPINPDINLWEGALLRLHQAGVEQIGAIHRGFSTYGESFYRNTPIWQIPIELKLRHPELSIIVDPSHIGGERHLIEALSRTALAMNFDGLMIETHINPERALSDAKQQVIPEQLDEILRHIGTPLVSDLHSPELESWREEINQIDEDILHLLAKRLQTATHIGQYKHARNMCILQPERYRELMQARVAQGNSLSLRSDFVHDLFSLIHEESVLTQQKVQ